MWSSGRSPNRNGRTFHLVQTGITTSNRALWRCRITVTEHWRQMPSMRRWLNLLRPRLQQELNVRNNDGDGKLEHQAFQHPVQKYSKVGLIPWVHSLGGTHPLHSEEQLLLWHMLGRVQSNEQDTSPWSAMRNALIAAITAPVNNQCKKRPGWDWHGLHCCWCVTCCSCQRH